MYIQNLKIFNRDESPLSVVHRQAPPDCSYPMVAQRALIKRHASHNKPKSPDIQKAMLGMRQAWWI